MTDEYMIKVNGEWLTEIVEIDGVKRERMKLLSREELDFKVDGLIRNNTFHDFTVFRKGSEIDG